MTHGDIDFENIIHSNYKIIDKTMFIFEFINQNNRKVVIFEFKKSNVGRMDEERIGLKLAKDPTAALDQIMMNYHSNNFRNCQCVFIGVPFTGKRISSFVSENITI